MRLSLEHDANGLGLGVHLHRHASMFASESGLLIAAERHVGVHEIVAVLHRD